MRFAAIKIRPIIWMILALALTGCSSGSPVEAAPAGSPQSNPESDELTVFAAASLTDAFTEIGAIFESGHPGIKVLFNFAGSQQLAQQIDAGAPADVFASANNGQMQVVVDAGETIDDPRTFVSNRLVMIFPKDNPAGIQALQDLGEPGTKVVFATAEVPAGQYSLEFLDKASAVTAFGSTFKSHVLENVVSYEDNVRMVLTKIALGEADAGIVYSSDISGTDALQVDRLDIPGRLNVIATYPIAPLKASKNPVMAQAFIDLVLSQEGQAILARYNFIPVE